MTTKREIESFNVEQLCDFLTQLNQLSEQTIASFSENRISGAIFFELGNDDLREIVPVLGERKVLEKLMRSYKPTEAVSHVQVHACVYSVKVSSTSTCS